MKMTYNDVFVRYQLLCNVPAERDGRRLCAVAATSVLLLRVAFQKKVAEFEETMSRALAELRKEVRFGGLEVACGESGERLRREFEEAYGAVRLKESGTETEVDFQRLTRQELEGIVDVVGMEGEMEFRSASGEVSRERRCDFLALIAEWFA